MTCLDLSVQAFDARVIQAAHLVAFYLPMHTATRIALTTIPRVRQINPQAHLCCYGLYAPMNAGLLRSIGVETILGGEFEEWLAALGVELGKHGMTTRQISGASEVSLARQRFLVPDRDGLPALEHYAHVNLETGEQRVAGYTEASRGCKHRCRHCPIVPVYDGAFRIVQRDVVLEDISRQVDVGAQHITFGDPDFFNGPGHALPIVLALHARWPRLTYDVTIKGEHLLQHRRHLGTLRATGCLFITSAVESFDDRILAIFDKRHTRADVIDVVGLLRDEGLTLNPTFVPFTPWTSLEVYQDFLTHLLELDLVEHVSPIQYAIRLLLPAGSKLLGLPEMQEFVGAFDATALCYPWTHPDPRVERLYAVVRETVEASQRAHESRRVVFDKIARLVGDVRPPWTGFATSTPARALKRAIPHLSEPWFC